MKTANGLITSKLESNALASNTIEHSSDSVEDNLPNETTTVASITGQFIKKYVDFNIDIHYDEITA